jgi:Holliday junction resolvase RusA-like endonuclease
MKVMKPDRGELIAVLPLFETIHPLARPRLNYHSKKVYQPKENQQGLLSTIKNYEPMEIGRPCIVDTYINFEKQKGTYPVANKYGDEDNLRKAICDALQHGKIISDDRFIVGGENYKAFNEEDICLVKIYEATGESEVDVSA